MTIETRAAIGPHQTRVDKTGAWNGPQEVARLKTDQNRAFFSRMFAWQDPDADPEKKGSYKFPHHRVDTSGNPGPAVLAAARAGIAVLNGARIPAGSQVKWNRDRAGIYRHLAQHILDAGEEPAPLKRWFSGSGIERRFAELEGVSIDRSERKIEGYVAVFRSFSQPIGFGQFVEHIRPGAFKKTLEEADIRALFNHNPHFVLGRVRAGTLEVSEDSHGLHFRATPPDATWAKDLLESMDRGDIDQGSFTFETVRDAWSEDQKTGRQVRELIEVKLFDVGPVTFPAYTETSVQARALAGTDVSIEDFAHCYRLLRSGASLAPAEIEVLDQVGQALTGRVAVAPDNDPQGRIAGHPNRSQGDPAPNLELARRQLRLVQAMIAP